MNNINYSFFRKKLFEFTNTTFDLVSTVDHPYVSPPEKLVDCHYKLKRFNDIGLKPLICIWDVNFPNINRYRYELILDVGIFDNRDKDFFIFSDKILYPLQKPILINFCEFRKRIKWILKGLHNLPKELKNNRDKRFLDNLEEIFFIYKAVIQISRNGTDFYQHLLKRFYVLMGFVELADFVENSFQPYFESVLIQKWIPYCIKETKDESYGILNLLNKGLFKKPYFRSLSMFNENQLSDRDYIKKNIYKIIAEIEKNNLIPSYEIFFWTLFLANIKHFGNDYDFYKKLADVAMQNNFKGEPIQLTKHNQDCQNIIRFEKDISFNCFVKNGEYITKKNNPMKISRISSLPALYCHLGNELGVFMNHFLENKIEHSKIIKMAE